MPQPNPGQDWRHDWIPITPQAARSKNHGRRPAAKSAISRVMADAAVSLNRMKAQDKRKAEQRNTPTASAPSAPKANAPSKASAKTPAAKAPTAKTPQVAKAAAPSKQKPGKPVGVDSRNTPLRTGDEVHITEGAHKGKTGTVSGKGRYGAVKVDVGDGNHVDMSPTAIRSRAGQDASRKADQTLRQSAGHLRGQSNARTASSVGGSPSIPEIQTQVRDAYSKIASKPGGWVALANLRDRLSRTLPRDQVDEALRRLNRAHDVNLIPESNQKTLTAKDRAAAVHFGGQDKHFISIGG